MAKTVFISVMAAILATILDFSESFPKILRGTLVWPPDKYSGFYVGSGACSHHLQQI